MDSGSQGRTRWDAVTDGSVTMPVNDHMGFVLEETGDPRNAVTFTWEVPEEYCNSVGNLQGGVLAAFADAVLGASSWANMPADRYPALAEMKISIFRPAAKGSRLTGTGRALKAGRRVIFVEAEITDDAGRLVAKASGTEIPIPE